VDTVRVRYWAAARAAAGRESDEVSGETLADVLAAVRRLHADDPRFARVVDVCSVLVGERPVGSQDPQSVAIAPGETVELLPPFAGGA
jgi:sulfur-carrier protein